MQRIPPVEAALPLATATGGVTSARVLSGNLAAVPVGALLEATVTISSPKEAVLTVNGLPLTVRPTVPLQQGTVLLIRVPQGAKGQTLELIAKPPSPDAQTASALSPEAAQRAATARELPTVAPPRGEQPAAVPVKPLPLVLVDVLAVMPDGRVRVQINTNEEIASSPEKLSPGGRYVLQVERTPTGITLRPAPDTPKLLAEVAAAVLRGSAPSDLGTALKPLLAELATLHTPTQPRGSEPPQPVEVREAAAAVGKTIRAFLPNDARPLNRGELQNLVENGGLHFEAKLARLVTQEHVPATPGDASPTMKPERLVGTDLKGDLLRLLHAVQEFGGATQTPAAAAALQGIEVQQAANTLAQASATPYFLQVPFPDGGEWRTLHLALEPEHHGMRSDSDRPGGFRMLMHVPLTELGETWIDAGLSDRRFRAVLYLEKLAARERVAAELPGLSDELLSDGFAEVLLDVRPSSDLPARHRRQAAAMHAGRPEGIAVLDVRV